MSRLKILVGTVTGNAEYVAQAIQMDCADLVDTIDVQLMDGLDTHAFDDTDCLYLICTSTYGAGDVPDNGMALYDSLDTQPLFLGHVRYGVIALGDSGAHQPTFCWGGKKFDERLAGLGAQRVGELWCHDDAAGTTPEVEGAAWCRQWLASALQTTKV